MAQVQNILVDAFTFPDAGRVGEKRNFFLKVNEFYPTLHQWQEALGM